MEFLKKIDFPGKKCSFRATSEQIILFLFKSHQFRKNFLYIIRYNNISRLVHDPSLTHHHPPGKKLGGATPQPPGLTPLACILPLLFTSLNIVPPFYILEHCKDRLTIIAGVIYSLIKDKRVIIIIL